MAYFNKSVMTNRGMELLSKSFAGEIVLEFVKMVAGSGIYSELEKKEEALREREELKEKQQESYFSSKEIVNGNCIALKSLISNELIVKGYYITEIGIYAKERGTEDSTAVLYSVAVAEVADYMPEYNGNHPAQIIQEYYATVNRASEIVINVHNGAVALAEDLTAHINNTDNPHQVTKAHVGLGNVDNTADSEKPVSREQQRVIDEKHRMSTDYTDQKVAEAKAENKNVVDALNNAIGMKADNGHNHDDRYYTEGEVNGLLANKADSNHTHTWGTLPGTPSTFPPTPHAHDYLPLTGGTVNGNLAVTGNLSSDRYYTATPDKTMVIESGGFVNIQVGQSAQVRTYGDTGWAAISAREFVQQSSKRYKENIEEMTEIYAKKLLELRPVSYDYKNKADGVDCYGLIAEEVDEVESYPVFYNANHKPEGIDYSKFVPQIIKMLQIHEQDIRKLMEK